MVLYNEIELNYLNTFWKDSNIRVGKDRSYKFCVCTDCSEISKKLYDWFELETGEKLLNRPNYLFIHNYEEGDYFDLHIDSVERDYKNRAYVLGFHINDEYDGGEYVLYNPYEIINKAKGVPYCFKSDRPHEIKKVLNGNRKSALIFIHHQDLEKVKKLL